MKLSDFDNNGFDRGRPVVVEAAWRAIEGLLFSSWLPGSGWRVFLLRSFGARIGEGVVIKPRVRIKFPWRLSVGAHSWIGESAWIDNLAEVSVGHDSCISQGAYLCTGSHRWDRETFDLETQLIVIGNECWIGAMCKVVPGAVLEDGVVLMLGSVAKGRLDTGGIYSGSPAVFVKKREER